VGCEEAQQLAGAGAVGGVHDGVVEHHAGGAGPRDRGGEPAGEVGRRQAAPVDVDGQLADAGQVQRGGARLARERPEAQLE
jgi:hypothetical protein